MSWPDLFAIFVLCVLVTAPALNLWYADLSSDGEAGELLYDGAVRVQHRRSRDGRFSPLIAGFRPIKIRGSAVLIGTSTGIVRLIPTAMGLTYRLDAKRFEVARERIVPPPIPFSFVRSADGVVIRGSNHRGRSEAFTLVPRDGDVTRLYEALKHAGAHEGRRGGTTSVS